MTATPLPPTYRFGRFELQPDTRRLLTSGAPVDVGSRAFDLLVVLVERDGHVVTKDELLERVWPRVIVEENTLQAQVSARARAGGRCLGCGETPSGGAWTQAKADRSTA
jgi:DNA-binding response OmpR family regulator